MLPQAFLSELGFEGFSKWTSVLVLGAMVLAFRLGMVIFTQVRSKHITCTASCHFLHPIVCAGRCVQFAT
jgi:hypothetical protein